MSTGMQYDYNQIAQAIRDANGKITLAARAIGCTRKTIYDYAKRYATVQTAIDESRATFDEELLDFSKAKLRTAVLDGEAWAIRYVLDKKGSQRGYMDAKRTEIANADDKPFEVNTHVQHGIDDASQILNELKSLGVFDDSNDSKPDNTQAD